MENQRTGAEPMRLKILLTGKNRRIAADISDHLESDRGYSTVKCPAKKTALFEMVPREMPHVIIICLSDENRDSVHVYDILKEYLRLDSTTVMVVAGDDDRVAFMNNTALNRLFFLSRPVSLFALYEKLNEIEQDLSENRGRNNDLISEFINPDPTEKFDRRRIVVVDDDPEQLIQIKEHLKEFYDVSLMGSGKNLFRFLEKNKPDLVLLDYLMPEMDGPEVLTELRQYKEYSDIPVIFLTGVSEKETVVKTLVELKPQGYVLKPTRKSELVAKIIDVIG